MNESLAPGEARRCEADCPLFVYLPRLVRLTRRQWGKTLPCYELAVNDGVCLTCAFSLSAGDYCAAGFARTCPLSRYSLEAIGIIDRLIERKIRASALPA